MDKIIIKGARENNLQDIDLEIPKNKMVIMTGVSGSGKTTLAFDTIFKEGQRRYVESLSTYARQFLGGLEKPNVDSIEGLSPAISIDQKTTNNNPRSTVGTTTEIYDYLRIIYARIGIPYCPNHKIPILRQSITEMVFETSKLPLGTKVQVLSPIVVNKKGSFTELLSSLLKEGFIRAKIDGKVEEINPNLKLDEKQTHNIAIIIDRLILKEDSRQRLGEAFELACSKSNGKAIVDLENDKQLFFNENHSCHICDYSLPNLEPAMFSFNSPLGACPECNGLGTKQYISKDLVMDYEISLNKGAIIPLRNQDQGNIQAQEIEIVCKHFGIDMDIPFKDVPEEKQNILLYGTDEIIHFEITSNSGRFNIKDSAFEGVLNNLQRRFFETSSQWIRDWLENYMAEVECPACKGKRLKKEILNVFINDRNIMDLTFSPIDELYVFLSNLELDEERKQIAELAISEILSRLKFLKDVGLDYLTLSRRTGSLSGGESQRIRLATQIGSSLTGVLYVLDEPSIGLHQKDNSRLIQSLKKMRDLGNTLIVVEHDEEIMLESDYIIDIGPGAGVHGGKVMAVGTPKEIMNNPLSLTGKYLSKKEFISVPKERRKGNGKFLKIIGAQENNLKNIDVTIPLNEFVCITGVSGSGKSTLVNEILYKALRSKINRSKDIPGKHKAIKGIENIDKIIEISQSPIGRTPRSNPATYTGVFDDIRDLYAQTVEARSRGYLKGRFSFNIKGGRCESCYGDGVKRIQMNFLPDVFVPCSVCKGTRYNKDTLDITYKGKNIAEVLDLTVFEAYEFFQNIPKIKDKLKIMIDVGLDYIKLGQSATTLSGGEAQRVKLASELYKKITKKTLYIFDEPTTGLHTHDIKKIIYVLDKIVDDGGSVLIIEHNLDIIKVSDHIIDLGPEGGLHGGTIVATGTPEEIANVESSYTGQYLKKVL